MEPVLQVLFLPGYGGLLMIRLKSASDIEHLRVSGAKLGEVLRQIGEMVSPGVTTRELDHAAELRIRELGAKSAFLHYNGYPATLCVSINEQVIHGIPGHRVLNAGDVVSLDLGLIYEGYLSLIHISEPTRLGMISYA